MIDGNWQNWSGGGPLGQLGNNLELYRVNLGPNRCLFY